MTKRTRTAQRGKSKRDQKFEQMLIDHGGFPPWKRDYQWDRPRSRREFDFAWPEHRVAVEMQSEGHKRYGRYLTDCRKLNDAQLAGWRLLWLHPSMMREGIAYLEQIFSLVS